MRKLVTLFVVLPMLMLGGPGFITQYFCIPGCLNSEVGEVAITEIEVDGLCSNGYPPVIGGEADGFCPGGIVEVVAVNDTNLNDVGVSATTEVYIYEFNPFFVSEYSEGSGIADCQGQFMGDPNTSGDC